MTLPRAGELLELARSAAVEAGQLLAARRPAGRPAVLSTKSSPTDVVTAMDRAAETLIRTKIWAQRPGDAILGEEGGESGNGRVRWIVDPLDGTVNYLYGLPDWSVSIGVEVLGTIVAGAVVVPERGEEFCAMLGAGAWLWQARRGPPVPLKCTTGVPLAQALIGTGFGYAANRRQVQGEVVAAVLPQVRDVRRGGSAAIDLCSVAAGRMDGYYERGTNYWDIAAGSLIATEAGAQVAGLAGRAAGPAMTVAAGPGVFAALQDLLAGLDPERDA
ncbi:MAG: inositol monophosphatase family protein [Actinomycetota bacterium]